MEYGKMIEIPYDLKNESANTQQPFSLFVVHKVKESYCYEGMLMVFAVLKGRWSLLALLVKNLDCIKLLLTRHRDNTEASTGKSFSDVDRLEKRNRFRVIDLHVVKMVDRAS